MKQVDFETEIDFVEVLNKVDPLVDRSCHFLDGSCDCKSISECKYLSEHPSTHTRHPEPPSTTK